MLDNVKVLTHSSIKIKKNKIIYIDPFNVNEKYNDADIIFITHDHYDHYSEQDIDKVKKDNTIFIVPKSLLTKLLKKGINQKYIIEVDAYQTKNISEIRFETIPAYNINKNFHPKEKGWIGYIIEIDKVKYYIAGDTDANDDNKKVNCDVAFIPIGGTYTMNFKEAAQFVNQIKPQIAVPIHYGSIVGKEEDAEKFIKLLDCNIKGVILMK